MVCYANSFHLFSPDLTITWIHLVSYPSQDQSHYPSGHKLPQDNSIFTHNLTKTKFSRTRSFLLQGDAQIIMEARHKDCMPCRLASGTGIIGLGVYLFVQSRKLLKKPTQRTIIAAMSFGKLSQSNLPDTLLISFLDLFQEPLALVSLDYSTCFPKRNSRPRQRRLLHNKILLFPLRNPLYLTLYRSWGLL